MASHADAASDATWRTIETIFHPESIAVVGASNSPDKPGYHMIRNLLAYGYRGRIYPINPREKSIAGVACLPSALNLPRIVDLAILTIPAHAVASSLEDLGRKGARAALIHASGFRERDMQGAHLEQRLLNIATAHGMRLVGPNCVGIVSTTARVPWIRASAAFPPAGGGMSLISQSGSMNGSFASLAARRGVRFSKMVSVGNEADLDCLDFLEYLGNDEETRVIAMFIEGVRNGRRMIDVARRINTRKPIIVWKVGRSQGGAAAVHSHTGRMAGSSVIYTAAFRQAGIIEAADFEEWVDLAAGFHHLATPRGPHVAIITGPGAPGIACADACVEAGLCVTGYSDSIVAKIRETLPHIHGTANPTNTEFMNFSDMATCVSIVAQDPNIDMIILAGPTEILPQQFVAAARAARDSTSKPVCILWLAGGEAVDDAIFELESAGIPVYRSVRRVARVLAVMSKAQKVAPSDPIFDAVGG